MFAHVARKNNYPENYWDFWLHDSVESAEESVKADWIEGTDPKHNWIHKVINLDELSPEADFVNAKIQQHEDQKTS